MQDEVTVTQIDREAAANWFFEPTEAEVCEPFCRAIREGRDDGNTLVQTLARHRAQAERETLARMEWRDAAKDAAPKDGTRILVRNDRGTFTVEWDEDCINGWWVCPDGKHDDRPLRGSEPTHWMPLPPAPEAGQ